MLITGCAATRSPLDDLDAAVKRGDFPRTTSVLVVRDGKTVYERYWGKTDTETLHDTRSAGKSIASLAMGIALADGKILSAAMVVGVDEAIAITELQQVSDFFGAAKPMYNERGIFTTRAELLDVDRISDNLVNCRVRWPHLDANEEEIGEESSSYTLRRGSDGQLKMRVVVMRGEKAKH